jgi:hypothetical protein
MGQGSLRKETAMSGYAHESIAAQRVASRMRQRIEEATSNGGGGGPSESRAIGELIPFPSARQAFVKVQLRSVKDYNDMGRFKWLRRVVSKRRAELRDLGVAEQWIAVDCVGLADAFGLLPNGDDKKERRFS